MSNVRFYCEHCMAKFFTVYNPKNIVCPACKKTVLAVSKQSLDGNLIIDVEVADDE